MPSLLTMLALAAAIAIAGFTATGSMATERKAPTGGQLFHGPIEKVNTSDHMFKMDDLLAHGGKGRTRQIKATDSTTYKHLSGFGALHEGLKVDVASHNEVQLTWTADKISQAPPSPIPSGVTIHFRQPNKFVGFVFSKDPRVCASGRPVKLFRQTGKKQRPGHGIKIPKRIGASKLVNGKYKWDVHLQSVHPGKYYARIGKFADCQKDTSKTIHAR
jgi:hypothetical protein